MGAFLLAFLPQIPQYLAAGSALVDVISTGMDKANQLKTEGRDASDADWSEVNASIASKRARLHSPGA